MTPGRSCPLSYRYSPTVFCREANVHTDTVYVIGGLYGNLPALEEILRMAMREPVEPVLVFNGDFNWFNVDAMAFERINRVVLQHVALRGNVETELAADADTAGCGCAYPDYVDDADVERSNQIMRRLQTTARSTPSLAAIADAVSMLPMHAVAEVGGQRIGLVHGDAESLSGWRFAHDSLHAAENVSWLHAVCREARLAGFASSHTCLPTFRRLAADSGRHFVINNGAAGMPNFAFTQYGLITRISIHESPEGVAQYGEAFGDLHVDALPVHYDIAAFDKTFLANWPTGSPAHHSYRKRLTEGPAYAPPHALGLLRAPSVCA
jgi:hypothetical protein